MFSNEVNTRDLYFSNPMDHYLAPGHELKASFESGFSSSYNQTGNSNEAQYRSSQELFSQSERNDFQLGACGSDYQKYISQNLLLGKGDRSLKSILSIRDTENKEIPREKNLQPIQKDFVGNHVKEIKSSLDSLHDNMRKMISEMSFQKSGFQEELSKLNEKFSIMENSTEQKVEVICENYKNLVESIKTEETDKKELYSKISEGVEKMNDVKDRINSGTKQNDKKLQENFRKVAKTVEANHKKQLQKIQDLSSKMDKTMSKVNTVVESSMKDAKENIEKVFEQKLSNLKVYIDNSIHQLVHRPPLYETDSSTYKNREIPERMPALQSDVHARSNCKEPVISSSCNLTATNSHNYNLRMPDIIEFVNSNSSMQIPASHYRSNSKNERNADNYARSNMNEKVPEYSYTNLKIKRRKTMTPLAKLISPIQKTSVRQPENNSCTPLITNLVDKNICGQNFFQRNPIHMPHESHASQFERIESQTSSPVMSVYEAATLAKRYTFRHF